MSFMSFLNKEMTKAASLAAASIFLASACNSIRTAPERGVEDIRSISPVLPAQGGEASEGDSGVLLSYEFAGGDEVMGDAGCRLRVENRGARKSFFLHLKSELKSETRTVFMALPPGSYQTHRLGCGISQVWNLEDLFPEDFMVTEGKVSYLGKVVFTFKGKELELIKSASRVESGEALRTAVESVPAVLRDDLVGGFSHVPIKLSYVEGELREGFELFARGTAQPDQVLAPLINGLKSCAIEAGKHDPVRLGRIEVVSIYKNGRFNEFKSWSENHAFSKTFRNCIEQAHKEFSPKGTKDLEVRTRY